MTKNSKLNHLPLENLDLNSNKEKTEECLLYDFIDIALKSGRILFFGISYSVIPSQICQTELVIKNHFRYQLFLRILHLGFFLFLVIPFVTEQMYLSPCCLVNFIKKGLHAVLVCSLICAYYCLEIKARKSERGIAGIFRQCVFLQDKFKAAGLRFPARAKIRAIGWGVCLTACLVCLARQYIFATKNVPWYERYARMFSRTASLGIWAPSNETTSETMFIILGSLGVLVDGLIANYWFFVQIIHFSFAFTMWMVFGKLNEGMKSGFFETKHLSQVVDLHFQSSLLLKLINQLTSPLTFWAIVFDVTCLCFWTNYIAIDWTIKPVYIAAVCFFFKTGVELILIADVNSKANEISEWLEASCATPEKLPSMDLMKFTVFTSKIYSRESTGFKGLNFFVVTSHLVIAVAGIVVTYTAAVNQFCHFSSGESRSSS